MIIPHDQLSPDTIQALVEEFVTRHGAIHGHHDTPTQDSIAAVLKLLHIGAAVIVFDEEDESASIVMKDTLPTRAAT